MFSGYIAAIVTPFKNNNIDYDSLEKYISYIADTGVTGIVVCGSTGESLSLSMQEKIDIIKYTAKICPKNIQIIAGVIDCCTQNCVEIIQKTNDLVDAFLCICPYYIKPSQDQIYEHFKTMHNHAKKSIILYNNPTRVGSSIEFNTFKKLTQMERVVAIKECASDMSRFTLWKQEAPENFCFLTGNDDAAYDALTLGAAGVISVTANVAPIMCAKFYQAFKDGDMKKCKELHNMLIPLHHLMFEQPTPAPAKYALSKLGIMNNELRMPLSCISNELQEKINFYINNMELNNV